MKKLLLGLGTLAAVAAPVAAVVACGSTPAKANTKNDKSVGTIDNNKGTTGAPKAVTDKTPTSNKIDASLVDKTKVTGIPTGIDASLVDKTKVTEVPTVVITEPTIETEMVKAESVDLDKNSGTTINQEVQEDLSDTLVAGGKMRPDALTALQSIGKILLSQLQFQYADSYSSQGLGSTYVMKSFATEGRTIEYSFESKAPNGWGYKHSIKVTVNVDTREVYDFSIYYEEWEGCQCWLRNPSMLNALLDNDVKIFNPKLLVQEQKVLDDIVVPTKVPLVDGISIQYETGAPKYPTYTQSSGFNTVKEIKDEEEKKEDAADKAEKYNEYYTAKVNAAATAKEDLAKRATIFGQTYDNSGAKDVWEFIDSDAFKDQIKAFGVEFKNSNVDSYISYTIKGLKDNSWNNVSCVNDYVKAFGDKATAIQILETIHKAMRLREGETFSTYESAVDTYHDNVWNMLGTPNRHLFWVYALLTK